MHGFTLKGTTASGAGQNADHHTGWGSKHSIDLRVWDQPVRGYADGYIMQFRPCQASCFGPPLKRSDRGAFLHTKHLNRLLSTSALV